jgi:UDP:flavonoid glycosyltransferase YjiC (YdhE family)
MRILFTTTAGIGHLHPLVPLARAAQAAGHQVKVAAPASLGSVLAGRDLQQLELPGYGPEQLARVEEVMRRLGPPGPGAEVPMFREVFGWAKTAATLEGMRRAVARWEPELVVHEAAELSGPLAAEEAGIAHATVAIGLRQTLTNVLPYAAEGAAELATSIGLPPDPEARRILDAPYATLVPASLEAPGTAMPAVVVRYRLTDIHNGGPSPSFDGAGPLIWIALGTETWRIPGLPERLVPLIRHVTEALPHVRFLLTTGAADASAPTLPANVHVASYIPQEAILGACDAVLGHGGFNTTIAALSRGIPLVLTPLFATDQFDNAARLAARGAAVAVTDPDPIVLGHALERSLTEPSLAIEAERLADEMAALPTPSNALERLAATSGHFRSTPGSGRAIG